MSLVRVKDGPPLVLAGLVPAIHAAGARALIPVGSGLRNGLDGRNKSGQDKSAPLPFSQREKVARGARRMRGHDDGRRAARRRSAPLFLTERTPSSVGSADTFSPWEKERAPSCCLQAVATAKAVLAGLVPVIHAAAARELFPVGSGLQNGVDGRNNSDQDTQAALPS